MLRGENSSFPACAAKATDVAILLDLFCMTASERLPPFGASLQRAPRTTKTTLGEHDNNVWKTLILMTI